MLDGRISLLFDLLAQRDGKHKIYQQSKLYGSTCSHIFLTLRKNKIFPAEDEVSVCKDIPDFRLWPKSSSYVSSEVNNYVSL